MIASRGLCIFGRPVCSSINTLITQAHKWRYSSECKREQVTAEQIRNSGIEVPEGVEILDRQLIKVGNRDLYGSDFRWVLERQLSDLTYPKNAVTIERREWGNFYGYIVGVKENGQLIAEQSPANNDLWHEVQQRTERATGIYTHIQSLEGGEIGAINYQLEKLRLQERSLELDGLATPENLADLQAENACRSVRRARKRIDGAVAASSATL